ncbi:hypothetical protein Tsubulata_041484 [Turnera subulata]|uniref:Peptidase M50 domain-containing protein n=1 Tax=Turnera subulata TaxID=218843 RepID=A0A9Q0FJW2_9ROSI|nr:hypothetical protein Tsubulata_041484 [Turnera subulata]
MATLTSCSFSAVHSSLRSPLSKAAGSRDRIFLPPTCYLCRRISKRGVSFAHKKIARIRCSGGENGGNHDSSENTGNGNGSVNNSDKVQDSNVKTASLEEKEPSTSSSSTVSSRPPTISSLGPAYGNYSIKLIDLLGPEKVDPADVKKVKDELFGYSTFWVTKEEPYGDFGSGILFVGNLRGDRDQIFEKLQQQLRNVTGDKYNLFMVEEPEADTPDPRGGPRVSFALLRKEASEPEPTTLWQYVIALLLFLLTLGSSVELGIASQINRLPPEIGKYFTDPNSSELPDMKLLYPFVESALPLAYGVLGILLFHEVGHILAAFPKKVRLSVPYFIPNITLGSFGAITQFKSILPDRSTKVDIALAGPFAGAVLAFSMFVVGLLLSSNPDAAGDLIQVPSMLFQGSLLLGLISRATLGYACGLTTTAFNMLPVGRLDGGRAVQGAFGEIALTGSSLATYVMLGLGVLGGPLSLPWGLYVLICQIESKHTLPKTQNPKERYHLFGCSSPACLHWMAILTNYSFPAVRLNLGSPLPKAGFQGGIILEVNGSSAVASPPLCSSCRRMSKPADPGVRIRCFSGDSGGNPDSGERRPNGNGIKDDDDEKGQHPNVETPGVEEKAASFMRRAVVALFSSWPPDIYSLEVTYRKLESEAMELLGIEKIDPADVKKLKDELFGHSTFWVTHEEPYGEFGEGVLFTGNLRGERERVFEKLQQQLKKVIGDKYNLFMLEEPSFDDPDPRGGPRVSFALLRKEASEPEPTTLWQYVVALVLFLLTIGSSLVLGITSQIDRLPPETLKYFTDQNSAELPDMELLYPVVESALPIAYGVLGIHLFHEIGHMLAAFPKKVKLSVPYFIPNITLGSFGAITQLKSILPDRSTKVDIALSGPLAGAALSFSVFVVGLLLSSDPDAGGDLIQVPSMLFQGSLLLGLISRATLGYACGLTATAFNMLPVGRLDGGRAVQGAFGEAAFMASSLLGGPLSLPWGLYVWLFQGSPEKPCLNDVKGVGTWRKVAVATAIFLVVLTLLPVENELAEELGIGLVTTF